MQTRVNSFTFRRRHLIAGLRTAVAGLVSTALVATAAQAVTLTNSDTSTYTIEVMVNSSRRQHELAPGKSLADICPHGCVIRLNASAENDYALEGTERVSIEGGLVYYDGEVVQPKSADAEKSYK